MSEDLKEQPSLSAERRALLDLRLKHKRQHAKSRATIARGERTGVYPLSYEQERLWSLHMLDPASLIHHLNRIMTLEGPLDVKALQDSFDEVVRRHEILRTTIALRDGLPAQVVAPARAGMLPFTDLSGLPAAEAEARAERMATRQAREPFDMAEGPLMRTDLVRLTPGKHMLFMTIHHVITDWWSFNVLYGELSTLYLAFTDGAPSPLAELPIQYGDFARWQRERLRGREVDEMLSYWKRQLSGAPRLLSLPTDRPRPATQTYRGRRYHFNFPSELYRSLDDVGRAEDVTAFVTTLAVFQVLLYRYTAQEDILVSTPSANRSRLETESLIGFLLNTLVLRGDLSGNPTFRELLGRLRAVVVGAYANQDLPFQRVVKEVQAERNLSAMPLVQVNFVFLSAPTPNLGAALPGPAAPEFAGLNVGWTNIDSVASEFDLTLALENRPDCLKGFFEYNTDLFDETTVSRMAGHLRALMEGVVANPDGRISELPLVTEEEWGGLMEIARSKMKVARGKRRGVRRA
ncbi:MAG TPA: condensation domain-containing protein [Pyrinomonadaceae bacterium]|jgi:aspartate racemase